jgi:hypothetical protein
MLELDLMHDAQWEASFQAAAPRIRLAYGERAEHAQDIPWERLRPGHYHASSPLKEGELVRGAVQLGGSTASVLSFGPILLGSSTEWAFDEARTKELRQLSASSGGRELTDLRDAWRSPLRQRDTSFRHFLLILGFLLLLVEALLTRLGWQRPQWALFKNTPRQSAPVRKPPATLITSATPPPADQTIRPDAETVQADSQRRSNRYARAKKS